MKECLRLGRETDEVLWNEMKLAVKAWGKELVESGVPMLALQDPERMDED